MLGLLPRGEQRALVAWSSKYRDAPACSDERPAPPALRLRYDGAREQSIRVGPHRIRVAVTDNGARDQDKRWEPPEIIFTAASAAGRDALLAAITGVLARSRAATRKPAFRMLDKWGDWARLDDLPPRALDSVTLPAGQIDRITADVARFLAAERDYERRGQPWHRGHLYSGPPGTGKTSAARAVAGHFGMGVWYLPLADVRKDGELLRVASMIGPRSMLLLEDADVFHAATERNDEDGGVTLSGLLNTLDGIATPHGLLTVLTTNDPDALDPAVIRPGRIDLREHFGLADAAQAARIMSRWYNVPLGPEDLPITGKVTPAEVIEACKANDDIIAALRALTGCAVVAEAA